MDTSIDYTIIKDYLENIGVAVVQQMFDLYKEQSNIYLADIEKVATSHDDEQWHQKCHKFKGATSSIGFIGLRAAVVEIEHSSASPEDKLKIHTDLVKHNDACMAEFEAWLAGQ